MTDEKPESSQKVTEPEARAAYLAQTPPRSMQRLADELRARFGSVPSQRTFENWSSKHSWRRLAREHDERVAQKAATIVVNRQAKTAAERAALLMDQGERLVDIGLQLAHEGDPAALVRVGIEVQKYADVLTGGVSDRTETLTDSPENAREREIARLMSLTSKIRGTNGAANGHANGHANGADHGADDTKH